MLIHSLYTSYAHFKIFFVFSKKVTFNDIIVVENSLPMSPNKMNAVVKRDIALGNVSIAEFFDY